MFLRQLSFCVLLVWQLFYVYFKGKTPFFFNLWFIFLLIERWLSTEYCFATCHPRTRLANVTDFFNVNIFLKCKNVRINDYSFKNPCVVCCLKIRFYYLTFSAMFRKNEFSWFHNTKQLSEILILERGMLLEFQNKTNIEMMGSNQCVLDPP